MADKSPQRRIVEELAAATLVLLGGLAYTQLRDPTSTGRLRAAQWLEDAREWSIRLRAFHLIGEAQVIADDAKNGGGDDA